MPTPHPPHSEISTPTSGATGSADASSETPPRKPLRRTMIRVIRSALTIYLFWGVALYFMQDRILFPTTVAGPPSPLKYNYATVQLERDVPEVGRVAAWFVPAQMATAANPLPLVVYFHGNAELIDQQFDVIDHYRKLDCNILLPEYRGYGRSAGQPSQKVILDDAAYFLAEALKRPGVDPARVVFHGRSLGGGPAALLAMNHTPKVLILESTFSSVAAMASKYFVPAFLVKNSFHVDDAVAALDIPILMFHGTTDDIIPVSHGRRLRDLAKRGRYIEYDCRHNDFPGVPDNEADYWQQIQSCLIENHIVKPPAK